ncbi:hypothetical protein H4W33_010837 [Kibdelosporangium phytohabitans]|uniref:Uncharacterized protein n=1 Tax=Kibdelosporangium phytohabitans TaxID=860235 RepID=A0A0N9HR86_9PSEU|nr:hypothetical protein [Kibdelosporangium phytohabitans]ALG07361.1 hypothetical protein AOZ06_10890 [Kibdelosporangium phytohabitans]MBE1471763.1 hypothetical protein [Kibdelosporangium phytohabitans]
MTAFGEGQVDLPGGESAAEHCAEFDDKSGFDERMGVPESPEQLRQFARLHEILAHAEPDAVVTAVCLLISGIIPAFPSGPPVLTLQFPAGRITRQCRWADNCHRVRR